MAEIDPGLRRDDEKGDCLAESSECIWSSTMLRKLANVATACHRYRHSREKQESRGECGGLHPGCPLSRRAVRGKSCGRITEQNDPLISSWPGLSGHPRLRAPEARARPRAAAGWR